MKIIVAVAAYNVENYIERCLKSIMQQKYTNFLCFITNDLSTDNTRLKVLNIIDDDNRFFLIDNTIKKNQCGNYDNICRNNLCNPDDIVVCVDGDDFISDNEVFNRIIKHYNSKDIWIANGSFKFINGEIGFSSKVKDFENIRTLPYTASHIRTWKIFLWRAMNQEELKDSDGNWYGPGGDVIFMFNMLEMAGPEHYKFMPEVNYIYDDTNPLSDSKVNLDKVLNLTEFVKTKPKKNKLIR